MKNNEFQLHCGACNRNFDDINELNKHIKNCPVAQCLLPLIYIVINGNDKIGHPISRLVQNIREHQSIIERYAYCIADELDTFTRSKLHNDMCKKLDINYNEFRPFESSNITKILNREEAINYLYIELCKYAINLKEK